MTLTTSNDAVGLFSGAGASAKWVRNAAGVYTEVSSGEFAQTDYGWQIERFSTNTIRNNTMQGAVVGSPGTMPTNWSQSNSTGLVAAVVGTGTFNGVDYIDLRINGTATNGNNTFFLETSDINALTGETWTSSIFASIIDGTTTNISNIQWRIVEATSGGAGVAFNDEDITLDSTFRRHSYTVTLSGGATIAKVRPTIRLLMNGAVDITIRIGWPQLEKLPVYTSPIRTTTTAVTRAADNPARTITDFASDRVLMVVKCRTPPLLDSAAHNFLARWDDGTTNNGHSIYHSYLVSKIIYQCTVGGSTQCTMALTGDDTDPDTEYCVAVFAETDNFLGSCNGVSATPDTSGSLPTGVTTERIGVYNSGSPFCGFIRAVLVAQVPAGETMDQATLNAITANYALADQIAYPLGS